jgi:hypothetical protein
MLHKKNNDKEPFRFWSCVLDASINEEIVDYRYLNQDNEFGIKDFDDLRMKIFYKRYLEDNIKL